jgi:hypothetical protein
MNYKKLNKILFIVFNLSWALLVPTLFIYLFFTNEVIFEWENIRLLFVTLIFLILQIIGYLKLENGNIVYAIIAVLFLSIIFDFGELKIINTLLVNIDLLYIAHGEFLFEMRILEGPHTTMNVRMTEFAFNKIGINAIGLIQIYFLMEQKFEDMYKEMNIEDVTQSETLAD